MSRVDFDYSNRIPKYLSKQQNISYQASSTIG